LGNPWEWFQIVNPVAFRKLILETLLALIQKKPIEKVLQHY